MAAEHGFDWVRLEELFHQAADLPASERESFLDQHCGGDVRLRAELESLLAETGTPGSGTGATVFRSAVQGAARELAEDKEAEWIGRRVGPWLIQRSISQGGMGEVFEVERVDGAYSQRAALKAIRWEIDTPEARKAFTDERQILARLEHPNVARLLDGGEAEGGRPYLVLEYVEGTPITVHAAARALSLEERLRLMITVCRAVHAAHKLLIIHQDLKPANIFITEDGTVKLLDFGIATLLGSAADQDGALRFSPAYASPEQVRGEPVSTATDVFALGAVLFELLAGKPPREVTNRSGAEMMAAICNQTLPPVSSSVEAPALKRRLRGDLDVIVRTATRPNAAERYQSAEQLAEDISRYLRKLPLLARPNTVGYVSARYLRRHWLAVSLATIAAISLVSAAIVSNIQARKAERRFNQVRKLANTFLFDFHDQIRDLQGSTKARESVVSTALTYLESLSAEARGDRNLELELAAAYDKVAAVQYRSGEQSLGRPKDAVASLRRAIDLRQRWLEREPGNAGLHEEQANSYLSLARTENNIAGLDRNSQSYVKGIEHGDRALKLSSSPSDSLLLTLARLHSAQALLASRQSDVPKAVQGYRTALGLLLRTRDRQSTERRLPISQTRMQLGMSLYTSGKSREAVAEFRKAEQEMLDIRSADPTSQRVKGALYALYFTHGGVLRNPLLDTYSEKEASELYRRAVEIARDISQDRHDLNAQRDLAASHCQYGSALLHEDPAASLQAYTTGIELLRSLHEQSPNDGSIKRTLGSHLPGYASALLRVNRPAALAEARRAVEIMEALVATDSTSNQARRMLLTNAVALAELQLQADDPRAAIMALEKVGATAKQGKLESITPSLLYDRARWFAASARAHARSGTADLAHAHRREFEAALAECARRNFRGVFAAREKALVDKDFSRL